LVAAFDELFSANLTHVNESDVSAATSRVFAERCFLAATMESFGSVNGIFRHIGEGLWFVVSGMATLVLWDIAVTQALLSVATLAIGISFIIGSTASQLFTGIVFVLFMAPYDIGDRVKVKDLLMDAYPMAVEQIGPMTTTFKTIYGESIRFANHTLAIKAIVNYTKSNSNNANFIQKLRLSTRTRPGDVERLLAALAAYVERHAADWNSVAVNFTAIVADEGALDFEIHLAPKHTYQDIKLIVQARSRFFVFLHAYIHEAGLLFYKAVVPIIDVTPQNDGARKLPPGAAAAAAAAAYDLRRPF